MLSAAEQYLLRDPPSSFLILVVGVFLFFFLTRALDGPFFFPLPPRRIDISARPDAPRGAMQSVDVLSPSQAGPSLLARSLPATRWGSAFS